MAYIQESPNRRTARVSSVGNRVPAYAMFALAFAFASALVLGLVA
jgi:hypothetical protein